jgi:hypothetical protein
LVLSKSFIVPQLAANPACLLQWAGCHSYAFFKPTFIPTNPMKRSLLIIILALCLTFPSRAQKLRNLFEQSKLYNVPTLSPDATCAIPLRYLGLKNSGYSLLVKVRLPGDATYYTIPGVLPTGDSFGCRLKIGTRQSGDTLFLTHRGGQSAVRLEEMLVLSYHTRHRAFPGRPQREFTNLIVNSYYDERTQRSKGARVPSAADIRRERIISLRSRGFGEDPR